MKILSYEVANKWVYLGGVVLAGILLLVILSIPSCQKPPVTPVAAINTLQADLEKPLLAQIKAAEKLAADYKSRLLISEERSKVWENRYVDLEKRKANVAKPTTNKEMRDRFIALGYVPLVSK